MVWLEALDTMILVIAASAFFFLIIAAVLTKRWLYFYVGIAIMVIYLHVWLLLNLNAGSISLGITASEYHSDLPLRGLWASLFVSVFYYAFLGIIGMLISGIRKIFKLKTVRLFYVSLLLVFLGIVFFAINLNLPCQYSPLSPCVTEQSFPIIINGSEK